MLPSSDTGVAPLRKISAIFCGAQGATRPNYVDLVDAEFWLTIATPSSGFTLPPHIGFPQADAPRRWWNRFLSDSYHHAIHANHAVSLIQHVHGMLSYHRVSSKGATYVYTYIHAYLHTHIHLGLATRSKNQPGLR